MAERPSVKDILAKVRAGGPAPAEGEGGASAEAAESSAAPAKSVPPPAPSLGRPLTLKEKLAAARAGGTAPAGDAPAAAASDEGGEAPAKAVPPPAPSLGRPMTLKEKLAAAKSGGTAPAPAAGGAAPAKPAAAKAAPAAKAPARELPPLEEISDPKDLAEALRQAGAKKDKEAAAAKAASEPAKAKAAAKPKVAEGKSVPARPDKGTALGAAGEGRRTFIKIPWIAAGWASLAAGLGGFSVMLVRFLFPNVLAEPPSTYKVGPPTDYSKEEVNEKFKGEYGFWIVRSTGYNGTDIIYALSTICTHLGCPPNWLGGEAKFKCPCHGSGFYISGINFEGPAPRPLERFKISLGDDGQLVVDKSVKFQEELQQWSDPDSFVAAV